MGSFQSQARMTGSDAFRADRWDRHFTVDEIPLYIAFPSRNPTDLDRLTPRSCPMPTQSDGVSVNTRPFIRGMQPPTFSASVRHKVGVQCAPCILATWLAWSTVMPSTCSLVGRPAEQGGIQSGCCHRMPSRQANDSRSIPSRRCLCWRKGVPLWKI